MVVVVVVVFFFFFFVFVFVALVVNVAAASSAAVVFVCPLTYDDDEDDDDNDDDEDEDYDDDDDNDDQMVMMMMMRMMMMMMMMMMMKMMMMIMMMMARQGDLNLPEHTPEGFPFVFVGDEAFALRADFLKPFNSRLLNDQRRIFNYRLSRARRVVENTFGILVARFGVLKSRICLSPEKIDDVVMACCVLHNFLIVKTSQQYTPQGSLDVEDPETHILETGLRPDGANIAAIAKGHTRNASTEAKRVRDLYTHYFNNDGKVPWQDKIILK